MVLRIQPKPSSMHGPQHVPPMMTRSFLSRKEVSGISIVGSALDARGAALWACKATASDCPKGATGYARCVKVRFTNSNNIRVNWLLSLNSQKFHLVINRCQNVHMQGVTVRATRNSPITDGIHVQLSTNVTILNSSIKTGDDCISIGPGTRNLWIEQISCGPGHGISIGSLAKELEEEGVQRDS
ncbi:hypothetical protein TIFTF001_053513 [Ficus carica]|uniref:Polygalacturonase n=1 Tax=Ficus carica TaxID=3494 RepID=A0AA88ED13_FICCA|nr:hypothetical protein TIFTF001_053513 [Ficus carica]